MSQTDAEQRKWSDVPEDVHILLARLINVSPMPPHTVLWDGDEEDYRRSFIFVDLPDLGWSEEQAQRALVKAQRLGLVTHLCGIGSPGLPWWCELTDLGMAVARDGLLKSHEITSLVVGDDQHDESRRRDEVHKTEPVVDATRQTKSGSQECGLPLTEVPNPSSPMSKKEAAAAAGGSMTEKKLTSIMFAGRVRFHQMNRQTFIFSREDLPGLPAPGKK